MTQSLFRPVATVQRSYNTSSANVALPGATLDPKTRTLRLYNEGTVPVFVAFGNDDTVTAAVANSGMPIPPGAVEAIRVRPDRTHIAAISASGSGTLHVTAGEGS